MRHPLWPDDGESLSSDGASTGQYLVVPSPADPRLVLPTRPTRAADQILLALRDQTSLGARAKTGALRLAARANVRTTTLPDPPLFGAVTSALGGERDDYAIGVQIGPPRANRKPVLAVCDRAGRLAAFAKCGVDELTDRLVQHEARALEQLSGLEATKVPSVISSGTVALHSADHSYADHSFVVQTPVPAGVRRPDDASVISAQVEVASWNTGDVDPDAGLERIYHGWEQRRSVLPAARPFADIASAWCEQMRDASVQWGAWHGDWRTTNMSVTDAGCSVWDWERYEQGVPVGYDALHLFLTTRLPAVHDITTLPDDLRDHSARLLRPFGIVNRRDVELVTTGYLLAIAGRYLDDGQEQSGARLGAVREWLLPHLVATSSATSGAADA
ncbi:MAG TPA: hypothetical protein VFX15_08365 [Actinomycetes bacterium]|nr:hypothetical protein [Actinomycetes bacterium]